MKNEYRAMREKVLFEEEKTYLPTIQAEAARRTKVDEMNQLIDQQLVLKRTNYLNEDQLVRDQRIKDREIDAELHRLEQIRLDYQKKRASSERREFIMPCPVSECRGFLSSQYKCGMCEETFCKDCHHLKTEMHVCDPNEVATVTELRQNTKPCPKCHAPIFKVDGCDQMFCIRENCHTAFSWRTGRIETGVIHNPEYLRLVRGGQIGDRRDVQDHGGCGPIPQYAIVYNRMVKYSRQLDEPERRKINREIELYYQQCTHHREITHYRLAQRPDRTEDQIAYLMGKLDEKKFKQRLFVLHQKEFRLAEERQIIDAFVTVGEEMFRTLTSDNAGQILVQFRTMYKVTHDAIELLDKKYQHKGVLIARHFVV